MEVCTGVSSKTENPMKNNRMKRLCKDVDITDRSLISQAVKECLRKKYKRNDTMRYMSEVSGIREGYIRCIHKRYGKEALESIVELIIDVIQKEIVTGQISFPKIWYKTKVDTSSGKVRRIGIQNIKQQLYDYIAVEALKPLFRRIGEYQLASIKRRGTLKGKKTIERWIRNRNNRYFVKLDVRKCFESIPHDKLLQFIGRRIKNPKLMELLEALIGSFEKGLSIGSYLSQYLCNLYMSILYHYIMEDMYKTRRGKRTNLAHHCLIYMDDILMTGSRKRDLEKAVKLIIQKAQEMGLQIKPNHQVREIGGDAIDMMGYKIYRTHTEIRGRIFLRIRRAFKKARNNLSIKTARKCLSYYGYLKHTNSKRIIRKWKVKSTIKKCKEMIRYESKIFRTAAAGQNT